MSVKRPEFSRALMGAVNADWAITEEGYRQVLAIASRLNAARVLESYESEKLKYTRRVTCRNGVAIIPVEGPIFRRANLFTDLSGATSVEVLAKDIRVALDNRDVNAILLEVNSPGGEVTGINELGEIIYEGSKRKPITARIGGIGASAAYWIASACGDIAIDETAQVGSIGVRAVYLDDTRNLEMNGFEEIEIISSQSPFKRSDPAIDKGRERIQARLDALCGVFIDRVARNRSVSVDTVMKDFGQGDVLVGKQAISAGLADRFGSFEESLCLLALAHNPQFTKKEFAEFPAPEGGSSTLSIVDDLSSNASGEKNDQLPETVEVDKHMSEKKKTRTDDGGKEKLKPVDKTRSKSNDGSESTESPEPVESHSVRDIKLSSTERIVQLEAQLKAEKEARLETERKANETADKLRRNRFESMVDDFAVEKQPCLNLMKFLADTAGEDSNEFTDFITLISSLTARIESGAVFSELGKSGGELEADGAAKERLSAIAKEIAAEERLPYAESLVKAAERNPKLYARYQTELSE